MLRYALRRMAGIIPTLLIIISASFFIVRLAPGGPFDQEQTLAPQVRANLDRVYGLDQPFTVQYWPVPARRWRMATSVRRSSSVISLLLS